MWIIKSTPVHIDQERTGPVSLPQTLTKERECPMSTNVYLMGSISQVSGFSTAPYDNGSGDRMSFNGMTVLGGSGSLYIIIGENDEVPAELTEYVERITLYEKISAARMSRETGIYRHESAEAELEFESGGKKTYYLTKIRGKKMEDVRTLLRLIKIGVIRPDESYENPQMGLSRAELQEDLKETWARYESLKRELREGETKIYQLKGTIARLNAELDSLRFETFTGGWAFCSKQRVRDAIREIQVKSYSIDCTIPSGDLE